jgi:hypothetical protein
MLLCLCPLGRVDALLWQPAVCRPGGAAIWQACRARAWWGLRGGEPGRAWICGPTWSWSPAWLFWLGAWGAGDLRGRDPSMVWIWWSHMNLGWVWPEGQDAQQSRAAALQAYGAGTWWAGYCFSRSWCGEDFHNLGVQSALLLALPVAVPNQACLQRLSKVPNSRSSRSLRLYPSHHLGSFLILFIFTPVWQKDSTASVRISTMGLHLLVLKYRIYLQVFKF